LGSGQAAIHRLVGGAAVWPLATRYNVVAVLDFNAGTIENKGLNIFNTKLVLARSDISTNLTLISSIRRWLMNISTIGQEIGSPAATGFSYRSKRVNRLSGRTVRRRYVFEAGGAYSEGSVGPRHLFQRTFHQCLALRIKPFPALEIAVATSTGTLV
jgi:hypothetical protein